MAHLFIGLVLSLAIGVSLGLLGGGGSILTVPILVYVIGLEAKAAIATSLLVVGVTSAAAVIPHARAGRVAFRVGLGFGVASMLGAFVGGRVAHHLPANILLVAFALMMLVTGLAMLRGRARTEGAAGGGAQVATPRATNWGLTLVTGLAVGVLTGVVGAGGGFVIVPALALLMRLPMPSAIATSLFVIAINSLAGFAGHLGAVAIDWPLAAMITSAAVVGSLLGARLAGTLKPETLRRAFAWLVLAMSVFMLGRQTSILVGLSALVIALVGAWVLRQKPAVSTPQARVIL